MFESRYSKLLTALVIIVVIAIVGLLGFLGYDLYQNFFINRQASDFVDAFEGEITEENVSGNTNSSSGVDILNQIEQTNIVTSSTGTGTTPTYQGFNVIGTIEIPTIDLEYPILESMGRKEIEVAVAKYFGPGPNQVGNTVIMGHNYRNGLFFSNNKRLNNGDKIYITDNSKNRVEYTIYDKYETTMEDTSYMTRDTNGAREVTLYTCTDDAQSRLIICARAN